MSKKIDPVNEMYEELIGSINQLNTDVPELLKQYGEIRKYIEASYQKLEHTQKQIADETKKTVDKAIADIEKKQNDVLRNIQKQFARLEETSREASEKIAVLNNLSTEINSLEGRLDKIEKNIASIEDRIGDSVEIDYDEVTTLGELCEKYFGVINGPLEVHRRGWTWDYYFVVEEVGEDTAIGNIYKGGSLRESEVEKDLTQGKYSVYNRHYFDQ